MSEMSDIYEFEPEQKHKHKEFEKYSEDLFKIAFRNYLALIGITDKKAGLLIQVNSIIASVIIGFVTKKIQDIHLLVIPAAAVLIVSGLVIFYSILASKPLGKNFMKDIHYEKPPFFFGSFDRLDPDFKYAKADEYCSTMNELFHDNKKLVFDELIKESFLVRKVLSKKLGFLDIAYRIFFVGLVFVIITFMIVFIKYA